MPILIPHSTRSINVVSRKDIGMSEEGSENLVRIEFILEEIVSCGCSSSPASEMVNLGGVIEIVGGSGLIVQPSRTIVAQTLERFGNLLERVFGAWSFVFIGMNLQR